MVVDQSSPEDEEGEVVVSVSNGDEDSANDGSFCYESDYEYNEEDSEEDSDGGSAEEGCAVGSKRKSPSSAVSLTDVPCPNTKSTKAGLKTTGLDDPRFPSALNFSSVPPALPHWDQNECGICHREEHTPVLDCSMIGDWLQLVEDKASGILAVDQACIEACMKRRVRECHARLTAMREEFPTVDGAIFDRSEAIVAVDLRRYHWNVENWQAAFRRRAELEQQLQNPRLFGTTTVQLQQMVDRLGLDEAVHTNNPNNPNNNSSNNNNVRATGYSEAVQQDHENFLRATMEVAGPRAARRDTGSHVNQSRPGQAYPGVFRHTALGQLKNAPLGENLNAANNESKQQMETNGSREAQDAKASPNPVAHGNLVNKLLVKPLAKMMRLTNAPKPKEARAEAVEATKEADDTTPQKPPASDATNAIHADGEEAAAWTCEICMDDEVEEEDRLSMECGHEYCRDCWTQFILGFLEDVRAVGGVLAVPAHCPHRLCRHKITRSHVERMAPELLPTYDEMALNSFLQGHSTTMRWCPGANCGAAVVHSRRGLFLQDRGEGDRFAKCDYCSYRFCFDCGDAPHPDRRCLRIYDEDAAAMATNGERAVGVEGSPEGDAPPPAVAVGGWVVGGVAGETDRQRRQRLQPYEQVVTIQENKTDKKIRHCPSCQVPIEKNGGCNHMRCKCGHEFCWLCMAEATHGMHFCGREPGLDEPRRGRNNNNQVALPQPPALERMDLDYVVETVQQPDYQCNTDLVKGVLQKRQEQHRFAHYYNRALAHDQGQVFAENQCECLLGRAIDFTRVSALHSGTDTDFFQLSNQRLRSSRRMLKYTYQFLYYKLDPDAIEEGLNVGFEDNECPVDSANSSSLPTHLALFLDHQERLERMTERLSFLSENALTRKDRKGVVDMINTVERCMRAVSALSFEEQGAK